MGEITYHDFELKIEPRRADGLYRVVVLKSPRGEGDAYMRLPMSIAELRELVAEAEDVVRGIKPAERTERGEVAPAALLGPIERLGSVLFDSLFTGAVRDIYQRTLGKLDDDPSARLRIKLHINPEDPTLAELASLPWEFLYYKERRDFLNLSPRTPIVRHLDVPRPALPLALKPPLRVLVLMASPKGQPRLDLEHERDLITRHLGNRKDIALEFMAHPTPAQLQEKLAAEQFHVLHYMGHGGFVAGKGVLLLEDGYGESRALRGEDLAMLLGDNTTVRLVFLNACETGRAGATAQHDPFGGVATALVMKGILAVVAMQFPVSDRAAIAFAERVYPLLATGEHIDAAVAAGRQAVRLAEPGTMEWGTPVLFMRARTGALFEPPPAENLTGLPDLSGFERKSVNVSADYWRGVARVQEEKWEEAFACLARVAQAKPDYKDVQELLARAQEQVQRAAQLTEHYVAARQLVQQGEWLAVVTLFTEIHSLDEEYEDREGLLAAAYYGQAVEFMDAGKWGAAVERLEQVCELVPTHQDAAPLLAHARAEQAAAQRRQEADALYAAAVKLLKEKKWQPALDKLTETRGVLPDYADAASVAAIAEGKLAEMERQRRADALYAEAVKLRDAQNWQGARDKLAAARGMIPNYPDKHKVEQTATAKLAELAEAERSAAARQRQADALYAEAVKLLKEQNWRAALDKWGEVRGVVADYADAQKVAATAQQKLQAIARAEKKRREEMERRERLAHLPERIKGQDGKEMILIPAGEFTMGSEECGNDAKPVHTVHLDAYYIDRYPVTNAEYQKFVEATGHRKPAHWVKTETVVESEGFLGLGRKEKEVEIDAYPHDKDDHPVVYVSWDDAVAYAKWAGKRLPTEAEWEKAARGTDGRRYPWGDDWDERKCNSGGREGGTTSVGKYSPAGDSPYGVADMAGNVCEWCADWYDSGYYASSPAQNPTGPPNGSAKVIRGGSWSYYDSNVRAASRIISNPANTYSSLGLRCLQ